MWVRLWARVWMWCALPDVKSKVCELCGVVRLELVGQRSGLEPKMHVTPCCSYPPLTTASLTKTRACVVALQT